MSTGHTIPLKVGQFHQPLSVNDLGRGFKLNVASGENVFKKKIFGGEIETAPMTSSTTISEIIRDVSTLDESMEISGKLGVSYGPMISGEGSGSYVQETVSNRHRAVVVYRSRQNAFFKRFKPGTLTEVEDVVEHRDDAAYIINKYGTKFIDHIVYGAQLDITFTVTSKTDIDMDEIEAELKGKIGVGALSINFDAKFKKKNSKEEAQYNLSINADATGVLVTIPSNPSFEQVTQIIDDFNDAYHKKFDNFSETENPLLKEIEPVGFMLSGIADMIPTWKPTLISPLEDRMEDLEKVLRNTVLWKAKLNAVDTILKERCERDHKFRTVMYDRYKKIQKDVMVDLEDKIDECIAYRAGKFENLFAGEVPNEYPVPEEYPVVCSPEEEVYRGLCGEHYLNPVVIEGKSLDDVYYIGYALKEGDKCIPWMDGTLKNSSDVTIATGETPEKLLANYLTASGTLQDGAIVSIQSASSDNYLDGRSPGKTGVKVNLTNRSPIGNKFLQWKLISFGDKWAIQSVSSSNYLDGRSPGTTGVKVNLTDDFLGRNLQWYIIPYGDTYAIKSVSSGNLLDGRSRDTTGIKVMLTNRNPDYDDFLKWKISKAN